jgi:hypothetical protein
MAARMESAHKRQTRRGDKNFRLQVFKKSFFV